MFNTMPFFAQQKYELAIKSFDAPDLLKKIKIKSTFAFSEERNKELLKVLRVLYNDAYLTASYDSLRSDSLKLTAFLTVGKQYAAV